MTKDNPTEQQGRHALETRPSHTHSCWRHRVEIITRRPRALPGLGKFGAAKPVHSAGFRDKEMLRAALALALVLAALAELVSFHSQVRERAS